MQPTAASYQQVVSVREVPGRYSYWEPALYEARARVDGVLTYRHAEDCPPKRSTLAAARRDALQVARSLGVAYLDGIRHDTPVAGAPVA